MRRSAILLAMLFAMLWQSVAMARVGTAVNMPADLGHAALHWQEEGHHHHHEDGSYHLDDSNESVQHVLCDHVCAGAALMLASSQGFPPAGSSTPPGLQDSPAAHPFLDGLLRPPRLRS